MSTPDKFAADLEAISRRVSASVESAHRGMLIELFSSVVQSTPVGDTGRLRGNWTLNGAAVASPAGPVGVAAAVGGPGVYVLSNNLPYAAVIEFDGHSKQAPDGMVRVNALRVAQIVGTEVAKVRT